MGGLGLRVEGSFRFSGVPATCCPDQKYTGVAGKANEALSLRPQRHRNIPSS